MDLDKLNWPLKRSHFPMHDQSPGAVQGPDSIHSSQHIYGLITRQTVFDFLQCYMLCFYCCLDQRKETMVQHLSQTEKGELNHYGTVFSVTRGRSATSTFCTYCGGCSVPRHIYILYCIAIIKSILFRHCISQNDSGVFITFFFFFLGANLSTD